MKINCLSCGFQVNLDDAYDDFEGPVKCYVCGEMLEIKTKDGQLKSIQLAGMVHASLCKKVIRQQSQSGD